MLLDHLPLQLLDWLHLTALLLELAELPAQILHLPALLPELLLALGALPLQVLYFPAFLLKLRTTVAELPIQALPLPALLLQLRMRFGDLPVQLRGLLRCLAVELRELLLVLRRQPARLFCVFPQFRVLLQSLGNLLLQTLRFIVQVCQSVMPVGKRQFVADQIRE